ncbi:MAG: SDR family NAD(P)-dependent oxidoreductase [bacterium]
MKALVTGGTGYLGRAVVERLLARGASVRCLARDPARAALDARVEVVRGDITDRDAVRAALTGVDAVFHMAAFVKTWARDRSRFDLANVAAVEALVEDAARAGVGRVLYTSSFMGLGPTDGFVADESTVHPGDRFRNDYERTKALGLARARGAMAAGAPLSVLIPGVIYGPGALTDGNHVAKIAQDFLARKLPGIPGSGLKRWTYSFLDDVADGHIAALERGRAGETYILGGEDEHLTGILALLESASGVPAPRRHVPIALLATLGRAEVALAHLTGRTPGLTPGVAEIYDHEWRISSEKAKRDLGYHVTPLREGISRMVAWLRSLEGARSAGKEND